MKNAWKLLVVVSSVFISCQNSEVEGLERECKNLERKISRFVDTTYTVYPQITLHKLAKENYKKTMKSVPGTSEYDSLRTDFFSLAHTLDWKTSYSVYSDSVSMEGYSLFNKFLILKDFLILFTSINDLYSNQFGIKGIGVFAQVEKGNCSFSPNDTISISASHRINDTSYIEQYGITLIIRDKDTIWNKTIWEKNPYAESRKRGNEAVFKLHSLSKGNYTVQGQLQSTFYDGVIVYRTFQSQFVIN